MIILLWIVFSIAVGMFAEVRRNRNGVGWFALSLVISPLLAGLFVAILRKKVGGDHSSATMLQNELSADRKLLASVFGGRQTPTSDDGEARHE